MGVDAETKEIAAVDLTASDVHDSSHMPTILDAVRDPVRQVSGDRAYDTGRCYEVILARRVLATISPRHNARVSTAKDPPAYRVERDAIFRRIRKEGRYAWRTASGATRQSIAENAMSRFKALVGVKLAARAFENQRVEALVKRLVLNRMASLGMPISERVLQG